MPWSLNEGAHMHRMGHTLYFVIKSLSDKISCPLTPECSYKAYTFVVFAICLYACSSCFFDSDFFLNEEILSQIFQECFHNSLFILQLVVIEQKLANNTQLKKNSRRHLPVYPSPRLSPFLLVIQRCFIMWLLYSMHFPVSEQHNVARTVHIYLVSTYCAEWSTSLTWVFSSLPSNRE